MLPKKITGRRDILVPIRTVPFTVGLGPSHATRTGERVPLAMHRSRVGFPRYAPIAGDRPPRYGKRPSPFHRRTWALACHTCMRAGFPRYAAIAGDRPPRYGKRPSPFHRRARALGCHTRRRAGFPRHAPNATNTKNRDREGSPIHRRARACPSPCNDRGGQAPAIRIRKIGTGRFFSAD